MQDLEESVRIAKRFQTLSAEEMERIEASYRPHAVQATWFKQAW